MREMGRMVLLAALVGAAGVHFSRGASSLAAQSQGKQQAGANGEVVRGRYLAEEVARCSECHTPRDVRGNLEQDRWLAGATTWITPVRPTPNWAARAPGLAGLGSYTDAQMERVLEQGTGPEGEALRPPMHTYHLSREDARAIIAYLRSLPRVAE
jgi:mono/diheme cytochrome c family protein